MNVYFDKENLRSLLRSRDNDIFDDCLRMLKRQLDVVYNIERDEFRKDEELLQWVLRMGEGRGNSEKKDVFLPSAFPVRPIKSNSTNNWPRQKLSSAYLIDDPNTSKLKNRGCVLLGEVGEELNLLARLFCGKDYEYHHLYDLQKNFLKWEQLTEDAQLLPCSDIIINDRYLFANDKPLVEYNLGRMLKALAYNVKNTIDVVLFTKLKSLNEFGMKEAKRIIFDSLKAETGYDPKVTIVASDLNSRILHDRFVITNYRLLRSGDSFIYFNTKGTCITKGGSLDVDSLAYHETQVYVDSLIEQLQYIYKEISRINAGLVFGDKESRFLTMD